MARAKPGNVFAPALLVIGLISCNVSVKDGSALPEPSMDSALLVGDYLFVSKAQENLSFDPCDPRMMPGYEMASPMARSIAEGKISSAHDDDLGQALLDSLFSDSSQRFYMTVIQRTMEKADGAYAEALGVAAKRFFEERTCALAECCWENGCGDERTLRSWADAISAEFLIESENDPLQAFAEWSLKIRSRAQEQCDLADEQRTDEVLLAIRESLVRSTKSSSP